MDKSETIVASHLTLRGYTDFVYEPDGNVPPDFLVNGRIAIEVRRLNQNHFNGFSAKGLEEDAIPLYKKIKNLVASFGPPLEGESWFVFYRFHRPMESWKTLEQRLKSSLLAFINSPNKQQGNILKTKGFELDVYRTGELYSNVFVMAGFNDKESGGFLLSEMDVNIRHCSNEKLIKIKNVQEKYSEWWLALVDYIGYGLNDFERELFRDQFSIEHDWDKILIIDPHNPERWFEI